MGLANPTTTNVTKAKINWCGEIQRRWQLRRRKQQLRLRVRRRRLLREITQEAVNKKYCKQCKCLDPKNQPTANCKGSCGAANYKKDGNCDDENNNCGCDYDGGDCCAKSLGGKAVNKKYCKQCKCLDPKNQP